MTQQNIERDNFEWKSAKLILYPALKFGTLSGSSALLFGGVYGLLRSSTPKLFALASGLQCFALGSTFWATRGSIIRFRYLQEPTPDERIHISTIAGCITGSSIGALIRGRANILPGALMFSIFGFAGQTIYNHLDARHTLRIEAAISSSNPASKASTTANLEKPAFWQSLLSKKYSPMKILSDAEYESMLQERLLRVEGEIALLDERIDQVKHERQVGKDPALEQRRNGKQEDA